MGNVEGPTQESSLRVSIYYSFNYCTIEYCGRAGRRSEAVDEEEFRFEFVHRKLIMAIT